MIVKKHLKHLGNLVRRNGFDLVRFDENHALARRLRLLSAYSIDLVLDVGANVGQYAEQMRGIGYRGNIVSFEPMSDEFKALSEKVEKDPFWDAVNYGLGDFDGESEINISGNSQSSSILGMLDAHAEAAPQSVYVGRQKIGVRRLDTCWGELNANQKKVWLKLDVQGFERQVIDGANDSIQHVQAVQLELPCVPLYAGESTYLETCALLEQLGFRLVSIEPGFTNSENGEMLQFDGIFHRIQ